MASRHHPRTTSSFWQAHLRPQQTPRSSSRRPINEIEANVSLKNLAGWSGTSHPLASPLPHRRQLAQPEDLIRRTSRRPADRSLQPSASASPQHIRLSAVLIMNNCARRSLRQPHQHEPPRETATPTAQAQASSFNPPPGGPFYSEPRSAPTSTAPVPNNSCRAHTIRPSPPPQPNSSSQGLAPPLPPRRFENHSGLRRRAAANLIYGLPSTTTPNYPAALKRSTPEEVSKADPDRRPPRPTRPDGRRRPRQN